MSVTAGATYTDLADEEHTMGRMHAKPARRDLLWVLIAILACGLLEVWASWLQLGAVSGFPKLGRMTTGWILPVTTEAYWTAALYAWLADPAGPRSRMFAMWSAAGVFLLSLAGQESDHLLAAAGDKVPPAGVVAFITALPLLSIALIAILIHLRQKDRDDAAEAVRQDAKDAEIAALQAALDSEREALQPLREALAEAETARDATAAKADQFARKLASASGAKRTAKSPANKTRPSRSETPSSPPEAEVPNDVDTQAEALLILAAEPDISGSDLGLRLGKTKRYGQILKKNLAGSVAGPDVSQEPK